MLAVERHAKNNGDNRIGGAIHDIPKPTHSNFAQILLTVVCMDLRMLCLFLLFVVSLLWVDLLT